MLVQAAAACATAAYAHARLHPDTNLLVLIRRHAPTQPPAVLAVGCLPRTVAQLCLSVLWTRVALLAAAPALGLLGFPSGRVCGSLLLRGCTLHSRHGPAAPRRECHDQTPRPARTHVCCRDCRAFHLQLGQTYLRGWPIVAAGWTRAGHYPLNMAERKAVFAQLVPQVAHPRSPTDRPTHEPNGARETSQRRHSCMRVRRMRGRSGVGICRSSQARSCRTRASLSWR